MNDGIHDDIALGTTYIPILLPHQVASQDEDISSLREAVHTESLRAEHASKMLAKYVKRAAAAADAAAGASQPTAVAAPAAGGGARRR